MILAGDVGGTNTRIALCELSGPRISIVEIEHYKSQEHESLLHIVEHFRSTRKARVEKACFGVAGPVTDGRSRISNLRWVVESEELARILGLDEVKLVNDLEAKAWGLGAIEPGDFIVLNQGAANPAGNQALIAAGTGLGEAGLHYHGNGYRPFASEGGHTDFAPRNELEIDLLRYLLKELSHVSYERVVSGPGLFNIYRFLRDTGRAEEPRWLAEEMRELDPPPLITAHGLEGSAEICVQAVDLFVSIYGAESSNLALKLLATGGLFVGGGIAPRILPKLKERLFLDAFTRKGRMSWLVERIPVRVVNDEYCAIYGAARLAVED